MCNEVVFELHRPPHHFTHWVLLTKQDKAVLLLVFILPKKLAFNIKATQCTGINDKCAIHNSILVLLYTCQADMLVHCSRQAINNPSITRL